MRSRAAPTRMALHPGVSRALLASACLLAEPSCIYARYIYANRRDDMSAWTHGRVWHRRRNGMDRNKDGHEDGHGAGAARSGSRFARRRSTAKWLSIVALASGALWDAWNVATLVERGDTPEI